MILVRAIIQPTKLSTVQSALEEAGYADVVISDALGYGRQKGQTALFRGNEYKIELLRKITLELAIDEDDLDDVITVLRSAARTGSEGQIGDGKIFVMPIGDVIPM